MRACFAGRFLLTLECRLLNAVKVSRKTRCRWRKAGRIGSKGEKERQNEKGIEVPDSAGGREGEALGAALNWIESSRGNDEEESPSERSFRVLNFNYFVLRSEALGSKRRSICLVDKITRMVFTTGLRLIGKTVAFELVKITEDSFSLGFLKERALERHL